MKTAKLTVKVGQSAFNLRFVGKTNLNVLTPRPSTSRKLFGVLDLLWDPVFNPKE